MLGYVQYLVGKNKFQIQFENRKPKYICTGSFKLMPAEEEVYKWEEDSIFNLSSIGEG